MWWEGSSQDWKRLSGAGGRNGPPLQLHGSVSFHVILVLFELPIILKSSSVRSALGLKLESSKDLSTGSDPCRVGPQEISTERPLPLRLMFGGESLIQKR